MAGMGAAAEAAPKEIQSQVKGYTGYARREQRRHSDELLRAHLISRLEGVARRLDGASALAARRGTPELAEPLSSLHRKLTTICEGLHAPGYLESAFFESTSLSPQVLASLYGHEVTLLVEMSSLDEELADLEVGTLTEADVQERTLRMSDSVDALNQALFERESLLMGDVAE
ncbi:MAG: hypothetical protein ACUVTG_16030 [Candidatus Oleimicrobiaceae bacterium]